MTDGDDNSSKTSVEEANKSLIKFISNSNNLFVLFGVRNKWCTVEGENVVKMEIAFDPLGEAMGSAALNGDWQIFKMLSKKQKPEDYDSKGTATLDMDFDKGFTAASDFITDKENELIKFREKEK